MTVSFCAFGRRVSGWPCPGRVRARYRRDDGQFADTTLDRLAVDDIVAGLPVREFRSCKGRLHYSGWYWSSTLARLLVYESRLELARVMLADFDPSVAGIAAQPFLLTGTDQGRSRRHVPDLLLVGTDGGVAVVDVKAPSRMADPRVREQFAWTRRVCAGRGWAFEAWSGADPRLLANVRFLAGYRREALIDTGLIPAVLDAVAGQSSAGAIERTLSPRHPPMLVRPVVLHLLWTGRLLADLTRPLSAETPVWPGEAITG
ncbi:MAG: TnsA-like heteromeric transposase endonuclease subunit [Streptosporangiaceae bacterium]